MYILTMAFEWDENKNKENLRKHGPSFQEASEIFEGDILTWVDDRKDYKEIRKISIGSLELEIIIIVVVHTDRNGITRIISARRASKIERKLYNEHIKKTT